MSSQTADVTADTADHDLLLRSNLKRVFSESDAELRRAAIDELYVADPTLYEPGSIVRGREAIGQAAGALFTQFGASLTFIAEGRTLSRFGLGVLRWRAEVDGRQVVQGADAAEIADGRIVRLWVLLEQPDKA
jgi:hypothetical protein